MRTAYLICFFIFISLFISTTANSQTINFDETWLEFLENNKIANMSALARPDKNYDLPDYAKYLLMNTNNNFCQSDVEDAEDMMAEILTLNDKILDTIVGFKAKRNELQSKMEAYHKIDAVWKRFLKTKDVHPDELEEILPPKSICEKGTLAKYSYITAHYELCEGDVEAARNTFQNRTLKLVEKTSFEAKDVPGLAEEVARMKKFFQILPKLDEAWETYMKTGESPGFTMELPVFTCYPTPNMKEYILRGVANVCEDGHTSLKKVKDLQTKSGQALDWEVRKKLKDLEEAIGSTDSKLAALNKAWNAFVPNNEILYMGKYGYDYCSTEPLIRAYIMDGFAFVCEMADDMLDKIDSLQNNHFTPLDDVTLEKIDELEALIEEYNSNGVKVETIWERFVVQGDTLYENYESITEYCDNIQQVKDWVIKGLSGNCEEGLPYMEKIAEFQSTFEFSFTKDLECRVQKLRRRVWDCRYRALKNLAEVETSSTTYQSRLQELLDEYGMGERPELCEDDY
ncbi:MAG: hypothetical protein R2879_07745 [Saprospiraceae bacterium]